MKLSQIVEVLQVRTSIRHNDLCYYKTLKSKKHAETWPREHLKTDLDVGVMGPKANHCDSHVNCAQRLKQLNTTGPQMMALLGKVAEPSGSRTSLEEVGHQGEGLEVL